MFSAHDVLETTTPAGLSEADATRTKYERIGEQLKRQIREGQILPGTALPSEQQLASLFDSARSTVRQAMGLLEREGLVSRVQGKGTFVSDQARQRLSCGLDILALVIPEVLSGFYPSLQHSFEESASQTQNQMLVCCTRNNIDKQGNVILQLIDNQVGGVAIVPASTPPTPGYQIRQLQKAGIPVVLCHRPVESITAPLLGLPFREIGRLAGDALVEQGHRRCGFFAPHRTRTTDLYLEGFQQALADVGCTLAEEHSYFGAPGVIDMQELDAEIASTLQQMLEQPDRPTAIFTSFDSMAERIYLHLTKMGLRMPEDISLIGVGDQVRHSVLQQQIASVTVDETRLGHRAAELLNLMRTGGMAIETTLTEVMPVEVYQGTTLGPVNTNV
ncbi:Arabinose metabolism transcriptional repressor [Gimesia chilikensis]|uniref:Arabinose metabolism transcriptional repressor n=1 Tax=Gimesia chilikensis TaxID=2605989 RepID=A0A517WID2_9PLAN|nr:substrate-binding domain-containing protein [Gimesia chilikensis]QDU05011.1 Arabinose metabolism transcriptional repressor [Gimesia chilikensis]